MLLKITLTDYNGIKKEICSNITLDSVKQDPRTLLKLITDLETRLSDGIPDKVEDVPFVPIL